MTEFSEYGFADTFQPQQQRTVVIDYTHLTGDASLLGEIFSLAEKAKQASVASLRTKIDKLEEEWEQTRVNAIDARNAFQGHKRDELLYQNDVLRAQNKMQTAHAQLSAWKNTPIDPYSSKQERAARLQTISEYERSAKQAEQEAIDAVTSQNSYVAEAQKLAFDYRAKNQAFANLDSQLNQLRAQLEELQAD